MKDTLEDTVHHVKAKGITRFQLRAAEAIIKTPRRRVVRVPEEMKATFKDPGGPLKESRSAT